MKRYEILEPSTKSLFEDLPDCPNGKLPPVKGIDEDLEYQKFHNQIMQSFRDNKIKKAKS